MLEDLVLVSPIIGGFVASLFVWFVAWGIYLIRRMF